MKTNHTELPFEYRQSRGNNIYEYKITANNGQQTIAELHGDNPEEVKARARLIITACNNFDKLVEVCNEALMHIILSYKKEDAPPLEAKLRAALKSAGGDV